MTVRNLWNGKSAGAIITTPSLWIPHPTAEGQRGEIWKIEEAVFPLIELCSQLLTERPLFFLVNSYTTGLRRRAALYDRHGAEEVRRNGGGRRDRTSGNGQRSGAALWSQREIYRGDLRPSENRTLLSGCRSFCPFVSVIMLCWKHGMPYANHITGGWKRGKVSVCNALGVHGNWTSKRTRRGFML